MQHQEPTLPVQQNISTEKENNLSPFFSNINSKLLNTILILMICFIGFFKVIDEYSHKQVNQSIIHGASAFSVVKGLSTAISALKGVEFSIGVATTRLGELLEPVNEVLVYTSHIIMTALASLGLQKTLLMIMASYLGNILLIGSASIFLLTLWHLKLEKFNLKAKRFFYFIVFVRFSLAITLGLNALIDQAFIDPEINKAVSNSQSFTQEISEIKDASEKSSLSENDEGFWDSAKSLMGEMKKSVLDTKDSIKVLPEKLDNYIMDFMNLIALFLLKTIIIPIIFLLSLKSAFSKLMASFTE